MWSVYAGGPETRLLVSESLEPVRCAKGMRVIPDVDFRGAPQFDILIAPGGYAVFDEMRNARLLSFLARQGGGAQHILSVCTGSFLLYAAGLLDGKAATTNWKAIDRFEELAGAPVIEERWTKAGKVWTASGVSAGIDMTLAFIAETAGEDVASKVQLHAEYFPDQRVYGNEVQHVRRPSYFHRLERR